MKKYNAILDTNFIHNDNGNRYFGGAAFLEIIKEYCEIIIPEIVIGELEAKKKKKLSDEKESFEKNFFYIKHFDNNIKPQFNVEDIIQQLKKNEISHEVIRLHNKTKAIDGMKNLALSSEAPFEKESDKGFKDAHLYFTVLDYLENQNKDKCFVFTNDSRLEDAFKKQGIKVCKDEKSFKNLILEKYSTEYFIEKLSKELGIKISSNQLKCLNKNKNGTDILSIELNASNETIVTVAVLIEENEICTWKDVSDLKNHIQSLTNSSSFDETRIVISELTQYDVYLNKMQAKDLLSAFSDNEQINWTLSEEDVKQLTLNLYEGWDKSWSEEIENMVSCIKHKG